MDTQGSIFVYKIMTSAIYRLLEWILVQNPLITHQWVLFICQWALTDVSLNVFDYIFIIYKAGTYFYSRKITIRPRLKDLCTFVATVWPATKQSEAISKKTFRETHSMHKNNEHNKAHCAFMRLSKFLTACFRTARGSLSSLLGTELILHAAVVVTTCREDSEPREMYAQFAAAQVVISHLHNCE